MKILRGWKGKNSHFMIFSLFSKAKFIQVSINFCLSHIGMIGNKLSPLGLGFKGCCKLLASPINYTHNSSSSRSRVRSKLENGVETTTRRGCW